jgi:hypothetical protein
MNRNYDDLDDDIEDDDDTILEDGQSLRVTPLMLDSMDEVQRAIAMSRHDDSDSADHRPGWRYDDADDAEQEVRDAHAQYAAWLTNAHRTPVATGDKQKRAPAAKLTLDAARAAADAAYEERSAWLRAAYKERLA